jgi:hypothetical protein
MSSYFTVLYAAGVGTLIAVTDALCMYCVKGAVLCQMCLEVVAEIEEAEH